MAIRELNSSPGLPIFTHAWGPGGCTALFSSFPDNSKEAPLFTTGLIREGGAPARGTNFIFALELFAVVSAVRHPGNLLKKTSVITVADNDAAARTPKKGGPNHPFAQEVITAFWLLAARNSMSLWIDQDGSTSNPADAPSRESSAIIPLCRNSMSF